MAYSKRFTLSSTVFNDLVFWMLESGYDWKQIGISNDYVNQILEPKWGMQLISWPDREFEIVDEPKYIIFLLMK